MHDATEERCVSPNAGYSGTPLAKKLGLREGHVLALVGTPDKWEVPDLPGNVTVRSGLRGHADVRVAFFRTRAALVKRAPSIVRALDDAAKLWIAWPRKAGGHESDLNENLLREIFLPTGLVDIKVAAIDEDWSGLQFVRRKELRGTK